MRAIRFGLALAIFDRDVVEDAGETRSRAGGHENGDGVEWEGVRCGAVGIQRGSQNAFGPSLHGMMKGDGMHAGTNEKWCRKEAVCKSCLIGTTGVARAGDRTFPARLARLQILLQTSSAIIDHYSRNCASRHCNGLAQLLARVAIAVP